MNSINSTQTKFTASYGSSNFAQNDTNYKTQKNFYNSKEQMQSLNSDQNEAFITFKKSNTFNNDDLSNNNMTATFYKKTNNLNGEEYFINERKKRKVLNLIKNANVEKIKNYIFLKEINYAYDEIQRFMQEGDYASAKEMERELISLQNKVIQFNIDNFSRTKLGKSFTSNLGQSFKNKNNIEERYELEEEKIETSKNNEINNIKKANKTKNIRINNKMINSARYNKPSNDIMNLERNKKYKIPPESNMDNNNIIYSQIPYNYKIIKKEKSSNQNQKSLNNNINNQNNDFQSSEKINYQNEEINQKNNKEMLNQDNKIPQTQSQINNNNNSNNKKISNQLKEKINPIKNSGFNSQNENYINDNNPKNIQELNEINPRASYENFEAKILQDLDKSPEQVTFIKNNGQNVSTNPNLNLNSINTNINQSQKQNNIQLSSELPVDSSVDPFSNTNNPFDNLPESGILPKVSQNVEMPYNPQKENEIPNNKYPNYEDVDKNNLNNLSEKPEENDNINNNNIEQENIPIPDNSNNINSRITNESKIPNKNDFIPQALNQNEPYKIGSNNNIEPYQAYSFQYPKEKIILKQNKRPKRPKSSKNNITKKNNTYNLPNYEYPRKYNNKPDNLLEKKFSGSRSKSNSRKSSKSPKILFAEPSIGKCFACDVNCSISRSGNSPNKYVPYYGPMKKERKHITYYDGEKYGYYQYKSRIPENA